MPNTKRDFDGLLALLKRTDWQHYVGNDDRKCLIAQACRLEHLAIPGNHAGIESRMALADKYGVGIGLVDTIFDTCSAPVYSNDWNRAIAMAEDQINLYRDIVQG